MGTVVVGGVNKRLKIVRSSSVMQSDAVEVSAKTRAFIVDCASQSNT